MMLHRIPAQTRAETEKLVKEANDKKLKAVSLKDKNGYFSLLYCKQEDKTLLLSSFIEPELSREYRESSEADLNMLLRSAKNVSGEKLKLEIGKLVALEIKKTVNRNQTLTVFLPNKVYIRKVGSLYGNTFATMSLEVTGDNKGMTVWNELFLNHIIKFKIQE